MSMRSSASRWVRGRGGGGEPGLHLPLLVMMMRCAGGSRGFDDGYNERGGGNIDKGAPKWKCRAGVGARRATRGQIEVKCSVAEAK